MGNYIFSINKNCNGCGMCYTQFSDYFSEQDDGKSKASTNIFTLDDKQVENIKASCYANAIDINKQDVLTKQDFVEELEKLKNYTVRYPKSSDLKFNKSEYNIDIPTALGEHRYEYNSYEAAQRAAEQEVYNKMYSKIDVIILKIITEYRVKHLKPYYSKSKEDNSFFEKSNYEVTKILNKLISILKANNLASDLPSNFSDINIFPDNDLYWKMLSKGEIMADEMISTVRNEFSSYSYCSCSDFASSCDIDDMERFDGTDWRGNLKTRDKYCYKNTYKAFKEIADHILDSCGFVDNKIEDRAIEIISVLISEYNKLLKNSLNEKITYLNKKIALLPNDNKKVELEKYENIIRRVWHNSDGFGLNGEKVEDRNMTEIFVTESKNAQYFFDGTVLKKKYISNGIIHNDTIFIDRNFEYSGMCGYNGYICFLDNRLNNLYIYNSNNDCLEKIDSKVWRLDYVDDHIIYVTWSNSDDRFSASSIKCCKSDGSNKRTVYDSYEGLIMIKKITDTEITYSTMRNYHKENTLNWKNSIGFFSGLFGGTIR